MLVFCLVHLFLFYRLSVAFPTSFGQYDVLGKANDDGTTRFLVVSDWDGLPTTPYDTPSEVAVADAMGKLGVRLNTTLQLALGDNFYYDGVTSPTDPRFQTTSEHVFTATSLQTPWYILAGNYDHHGNVQAQIDYGKPSKR